MAFHQRLRTRLICSLQLTVELKRLGSWTQEFLQAVSSNITEVEIIHSAQSFRTLVSITSVQSCAGECNIATPWSSLLHQGASTLARSRPYFFTGNGFAVSFWFSLELANSIARYWFVERDFTIHNSEIRATHLLIGFNRDLYSHSELWTTIDIINDGRNIFVDKEFTLHSHWRKPSHDHQISTIHLVMVSTWLIRMLVMMLPSGNLHHLAMNAMNYPHSQVPKHLHMEDFALPSCVPKDLKRKSIPLRWLRFKDGIHGIWNIPSHQHVILSNISVRKNAMVMPVNHAKIFAGVPWVPLDPQNCAFSEL